MGIALGVPALVASFGPEIGQTEEDGSYILLVAALAFVFMGSLVMSRVPSSPEPCATRWTGEGWSADGVEVVTETMHPSLARVWARDGS
jgi:hypothetical protein